MYKKTNHSQTTLPNFYLPFGGKLRSDNRWVILADLIPWDAIEEMYAENFKSKNGNSAFNSRVAFGALIIKEKIGASDREVVEQISENPYLQYFLGFNEYKNEAPFDHSLMTHFRKRFNKELIASINDEIILSKLKSKKTPIEEEDDDGLENKGKLLVDATCTPSDVAYPTDLNLLNDAREKTEEIIDTIHELVSIKEKKPRTYRIKARKGYLAVAKKKRPGKKKIRKEIGKQLNYIKRNLEHIENYASDGGLKLLSKHQYKNLLVVTELYRQQRYMHTEKIHSVDNRIISISKPFIRPIVRGKAKAKVEFGAKVSASVVDGFVFADRISWDSFNEGNDLPMQIEKYKQRYSFYPESVHADKIYITMKNRKYCKERNIRITGVPLGRPKKETSENAAEIKAKKIQFRRDEIDRIQIEGKFGQGKRRFGLGLIMSKLPGTSEVSIMISFLLMNLEKLMRSIFCALFSICLRLQQARRMIIRMEWFPFNRVAYGI